MRKRKAGLFTFLVTAYTSIALMSGTAYAVPIMNNSDSHAVMAIAETVEVLAQVEVDVTAEADLEDLNQGLYMGEEKRLEGGSDVEELSTNSTIIKT